MTVAKGKVEASLAERGRPAMWANEQEAAVLSGLSPDRFRRLVAQIDAEGFPRIEPHNGLRFIPAILRFWASRAGLPVDGGRLPFAGARDLEDPNDDGDETWPSATGPTGYVNQHGKPVPGPTPKRRGRWKAHDALGKGRTTGGR